MVILRGHRTAEESEARGLSLPRDRPDQARLAKSRLARVEDGSPVAMEDVRDEPVPVGEEIVAADEDRALHHADRAHGGGVYEAD